MSPVKHRKEVRPQHCLRSSFLGENAGKDCPDRKTGFALFREDIKALSPAAAAILIYAAAAHVLFDRFCPMLILTGFPCPGCGMTRALLLVLSGQFARAWELQPPVYGWILLGLAFGIRRYLTEKPVSVREKNGWLFLLALLLLSSLVLYGYRIAAGFPEEIADPGRTLWETVRDLCARFL